MLVPLNSHPATLVQRDLCKLRLATARSYVKIITDGQGPLSYASGASLRLNAQVQGLGPHFTIKLNVQNTGSRAMSRIPITLSYNHELYSIPQSLLVVPLLIPVRHAAPALAACARCRAYFLLLVLVGFCWLVGTRNCCTTLNWTCSALTRTVARMSSRCSCAAHAGSVQNTKPRGS